MVDYFVKTDNFIKYSAIKSIKLYGTHQLAPLISITIPSYRRYELLIEAIDSAIEQAGNNLNYEIIIVDNDADGLYTEKILQYLTRTNSSRLIYYRNEQNIGALANWNRCIELARGKWMIILSDDDILLPNCIHILQNYSKNNKFDGIFSISKSFYTIDNLPVLHSKFFKLRISWGKIFPLYKINYKCFIFDNFVGLMFFKPELAKKIGGFNNASPAGDYLFWAKYVYYYNQVMGLRKIIWAFRYWEGNDSINPAVQDKLLTFYQSFSKYLVGDSLLLKWFNNFYFKWFKTNISSWSRDKIKYKITKFKAIFNILQREFYFYIIRKFW